MSTDFHQIQLTDEQKLWVAQLAEQTGKPWTEVLDERLAPAAAHIENGNGMPEEKADDLYIEDCDAWLAHFRDWMNRQQSRNPQVDDSRESIYPDRW
jgi:hypothetical protein